MAAASQIFYSTGIGWGTLPAFASYNRHDHNFVRDAWLVPVINCGTSFLAGLAASSVPRTHAPPPPPPPPPPLALTAERCAPGLVVFSVLGDMSQETGVLPREMQIL